MKQIKFIDLFCGLTGIRIGFQQACTEQGIYYKCVLSSEIKQHALDVHEQNYPSEIVQGDITKIKNEDIPDFDVLLAGFPCQPFSTAGQRKGFADTRGTMFFEIERILKAKNPQGFLLENVPGLVSHDKENRADQIGRTLRTIISHLEDLGYNVNWKVLNAKDFGVPQSRERIYIIGSRKTQPEFNKIPDCEPKFIKDILEKNVPSSISPFIYSLLNKYNANELIGKSIKDKRGGDNNIHSWDLELKGHISNEQKQLMNKLLKERRKKQHATEIGIEWSDGMPLTFNQIQFFFPTDNLKDLLEDLVAKGYLKKEYPKVKINGVRKQDTSLEIGYNIVTGKLSFEVSSVLDPCSIAPTLVATDLNKLFIPDEKIIRQFSTRECLRLFGYPESFKLDLKVKRKVFDLIGNTVVVPVIKYASNQLLSAL